MSGLTLSRVILDSWVIDAPVNEDFLYMYLYYSIPKDFCRMNVI